MKITLVGLGGTQIPPLTVYGPVELIIWHAKEVLEKLGHEIQIVNTKNDFEIIQKINDFNPDFVHLADHSLIFLYPYIPYPCAITSHSAYLPQPKLYERHDYAYIAKMFTKIKPNAFCLSEDIFNTYITTIDIPREKLFLTPNGADTSFVHYYEQPVYGDCSIYLAMIVDRKRQYLFQSIKSLYFAGPYHSSSFDTSSKNYLGNWTRDTLGKEIGKYGNLVLLSDSEAHPLACLEALSAGLGLVISEFATAHLDLSKEFITVIPEEKIKDIEYVEKKIIENRNYSVKHRKDIVEYAKNFDWNVIIPKYYIPAMESIINSYEYTTVPELTNKNIRETMVKKHHRRRQIMYQIRRWTNPIRIVKSLKKRILALLRRTA